uniref:Uncharacterized protein n=1 Tax=Anopheles farauti TaxID=69004 RepID=A0A182QYV0_9DIPT
MSSWKLAYATVLLATVAQATFLETYQIQLTELHTQLTADIGQRFRQNSELNAQMIEQDLLPLLGEATVAIRAANRDLREQLGNIRPNETTSGDCWESVDGLIYLFTIFTQWDLQDCAYASYSQWMRYDGEERFYPVAHPLHRASSEIINTIVGVLSEENPVRNAEDVESRLDGSLDHFNEVSIDGLQDLDEELAQHNDRQEAIRSFMGQCVDRTIRTAQEDVEYVVRYAEDSCV